MELTLEQALQNGIEAHEAGKVQEADRYYTAILKASPKHTDANHNMGVLAVGVGKVQEALPFFKTALEENPKIEQYWLSYIDALIKLDQMADSKAVFDQAKKAGMKGDGFDQIENRLGSFNAKNSNTQDPPQDQLQSLVNLYTQGHYQEALNKGSQLLKQFPNSVNLYNIIGTVNQRLGKLEEAIEGFKKAVSIKSDCAEVYFNMGNAFQDQGKLDDALGAFNKAISLNPNFAQALYNSGTIMQGQGKSERAVEYFQKSISLKPDYVEAYYNLGITLQILNKLEEATEAFERAVLLKPDYAEAYNNMGNALKEKGKLEEAIEAYNKAISLNPDYILAHQNISLVLRNFIFKKPSQAIQNTICSILDRGQIVRPIDISHAAISLLKFEPSLQKQLKLFNTEMLKQGTVFFRSEINELTLLIKLMSVCPIPDLDLEKLFVSLRGNILVNVSSLKKTSAELLKFQSALALQCFTNEYIYQHTDYEEKILKNLEKKTKEALKNNKQPSPHIILAIASYKGLYEYEWCSLLIATDHIKEVFTRQVEEPRKEGQLRKHIPMLAEIRDKVSSKVRGQYEESPYPRWVNTALSREASPVSRMVDEVRLKLHDTNFNDVQNPEILIAGCGTGQHSVGTAARFESSKVLAIDLSLSSLAYAKRKTKELGIENIEYMQADILDLKKLNKQFDLIESGGVLHHMDNPFAGWRVLTDCLKSGGLMKIGLYSELARQDIVKIRKEINESGLRPSSNEMKIFRDNLIKSNLDHHKRIVASSDLYSLSTMRDLIFHFQEHRFTIPLIKDHLDKLRLKFCGFESNKIVSHFKLTNALKEDAYDLDKWQVYEENNPRVFSKMYVFWCQKIG